MSEDDEEAIAIAMAIARERWALLVLARNQQTAQARRAAAAHLERLDALMKRQRRQMIAVMQKG